MNRELIDGFGGAHIKPAARKSIHSHCKDCRTLGFNTMGRYGMNFENRRKEQNTANQEQGHDEVDNVISKIARPSSPLPVRGKQSSRRKSCDGINNEFSEDESDEDNVLSKSSPAAFSIYSDELYTSANATLQQNDLPISTNSSQQNSPEARRINHGINNLQNHSMHSHQLRELNERIEMNVTENQESFFPKFIIIGLLFLCIAVVISTYYPSEKSNINSVYDKINFYNDVKELGEKYKVKDTSIMQVRTGVTMIFEKQDTGAFIFAYNSKNIHFNQAKFNSFIEGIAATASRYLRNSNETVQHVIVDTGNLKMQTEKEFMNKYEDDVAKTGVMLIKDVDNIPSQLAMALHYYCDEYSPLVKKSAIFLTLNLAKCLNNSEPKSNHQYIEKCLAKKWSSVGEDKIRPLLTRVVNIVVDVTSLT